MSKHDSSLSKDQFNLLKAFKKQISNPQSSAIAKQVEAKKTQAIAEELEDTELFKKALTGVKPIDNGNIAQIKPKRVKKIDAQTLAKRAAADAATSEMRRDLVGSGDRSERIRTYNYPQGRMTDHRINLTLYKLDAVMEGDLTELLDSLHREYQADQLAMLAQQNGG